MIAALLGCALFPVKSFAGELDATEWKMRPKGLMGVLFFWKTDRLIFENGQFTSTECVQYGFNTGPYDSRKEGDTASWSATQKNATGERMEWMGVSSGKCMTGSFVWVRPKGKLKTMAWKACKVK